MYVCTYVRTYVRVYMYMYNVKCICVCVYMRKVESKLCPSLVKLGGVAEATNNLASLSLCWDDRTLPSVSIELVSLVCFLRSLALATPHPDSCLAMGTMMNMHWFASGAHQLGRGMKCAEEKLLWGVEAF